MINDKQISKNWNEIKGAIRNVWAAISDEELEETKQDLTSIPDIVKLKYDETKESIDEKMKMILESFDNDTDRTHYFTTSFARSPLTGDISRDANHMEK